MRSATTLTLQALTIALMLTGCSPSGRPDALSPTIYAPDSLVLKAGVPVATPEGVYRPQVDELWHSHRAYMAEREARMDALAALSQARNNR